MRKRPFLVVIQDKKNKTGEIDFGSIGKYTDGVDLKFFDSKFEGNFEKKTVRNNRRKKALVLESKIDRFEC